MKWLIPFLLCPIAFAGNPKPQGTAGAGPTEGIQIRLKASDGQSYSPLAGKARTATVLVFLMHDCPVTNATAPELARLARDFAAHGVEFFGIYVTETEKEIETHRREYGLPFPGLLDPKLQLARVAGITRAPEAALFSPKGELLYRGRIDDRAIKPGTMRPKPSRYDLRLALESVLAGRQPEPRFTTSIGCYLPLE
ncbi:MAG: hypothetical protein JWL90_1876 [Chthoniobacteraceae bacterium]|nr:hypothetical protein [Chthoniobacteraceae bacterium]